MSIDLQEDKIDNVDIYNYDIVYNLKIIKKMIDNNVYFIFDHEDSISKILFRTTIYKDRDIALKESINLNNFKKTTENISLPEACLTIFRNHLLSIEEVDFYEIEKMCPDLITDKSKKIKIEYGFFLQDVNFDYIKNYGTKIIYDNLNRITEIRVKDKFISYVNSIDEILKESVYDIIMDAIDSDDNAILDIFTAVGLTDDDLIHPELISTYAFLCGFLSNREIKNRGLNIEKIKVYNKKYKTIINLSYFKGIINSEKKECLLKITDIDFDKIKEEDFNLILISRNHCNLFWSYFTNYEEKIKGSSTVREKILKCFIKKKITIKEFYSKELLEYNLDDFIKTMSGFNEGIDLLANCDFLTKDDIQWILSDDQVNIEYKISRFPVYRSINKYLNIYESYNLFELCEENNIDIIEDDDNWKKKEEIFNKASGFDCNDDKILKSMLDNSNKRYKIDIFEYGNTIKNNGYEYPIKLTFIENVYVNNTINKHNLNEISLRGNLAGRRFGVFYFFLKYNDHSEDMFISGLEIQGYSNNTHYITLKED